MKDKRTEIYTKDELEAKAELALMGYVTPVRDKDNIICILDYIAKIVGLKFEVSMTGEEIYKQATQYSEEKTYVCGISCTTLLGMPCVNLIMKDEGDTHFRLDSREGVLTYVFNFCGPDDLSELGYCFFKKFGPVFKRIA